MYEWTNKQTGGINAMKRKRPVIDCFPDSSKLHSTHTQKWINTQNRTTPSQEVVRGYPQDT
jgi:hypothetical protein